MDTHDTTLLLALSDAAALQIRRWLPQRARVVRSLDITRITSALATGWCHTLVADPDELTPELFTHVVSAVASSGAVLVIWTAFAPRCMRALIDAGARCPTEIVFRDKDDQHIIFRRILASPAADSCRRTLLARLAPHFAALPSHISLAVAALFSGHATYSDVDDLADATGRTRRTVERRLRTAGFGSAARLIDAGRLLSARDALLGGLRPVEAVAASHGFGTSRALRRACRRLANCSPMSLAHTLSPEQFVDRVATRLLEASGPGVSAV